MKRKVFTCVLSVMLAGSAAVCAEAIPYKVNYDYKNSVVSISGDGLTDVKEIVLQVLERGKTFQDLENERNIILYRNQITAKNGEYAFEFKYDVMDSGAYTAAVASTDGKEEFSLNLVKYSDFEYAYSLLNSYASSDNINDFVSLVNNERDKLAFGFTLTDGKSFGNELNYFMNYVKANPFSVDGQNKNSSVFKTFATGIMFNNSAVSQISADELYFENEQLLTDYNSAVKKTEAKNYFAAKMSGKNITDLNSFYNTFKEALILTAARHGDGWGVLKNTLTKYGSVIGIDTTASDEVYRSLIGNEYATGAELKAKYDELTQNNGITGGSSGGSGSFGGSGSATLKPFMPDTNITPSGQSASTDLTSVNAEFNDIEGVSWANKAILALADKGIIAGKGDKKFKPNDFITREEFVKIVISAMGISENAYNDNGFSDVDVDSWYESSVNIACDNGIISGISDNMFGTGMKITRQDMAVILYNALMSKGVVLDENAELKFEDAYSIAPYALRAVKVLYGMGVINGMTDTAFEPNSNATRAQAAVMVYGVLSLLQ